jgi:serralysin
MANSAPINFVPGTQILQANTSEAIDGLSILDFDAGSGTETTTLSVAHGTINLTNAGSAAIAGNGTANVTVIGTVDQINSALTPSGNVRYHGAQDFFGSDTLTVVTTDNGGLTDSDQVSIKVKSLIAGTSGDDTFAALPGQERIDAGDGIDTVSFGFKLTDAKVSFSGGTVVIDGPSSHTVLTGVEKYGFTDGTVSTNDDDLLVDDLFYYSTYHDVWNAHVDANAHYHATGWREGRMPNETGDGGPIVAPAPHIAANGFDYSFYLAHNPDVAAAGVDPFLHFETIGWKEGRNPNALFDVKGYLAAYADVKAAGVNPLDHYDQAGWNEGRDPSTAFDTGDYLAHNPDVAAAHVDPLVHYLQSGIQEGRHAFNDGVFG